MLARVEPDSRLLDVGIGTATALVRNQELVASRRVTVVGIDPEREYVTKAARVVAASGLGDAIKVHCISIYQPGLRSAFAGKAKFDAAYFSGSLTLMLDPPAALRCAATMLKPGGRLYVTQTFQNLPAPLMARLKPLLRRFTSVDFGRVTYAAEIAQIAERAGLHVIEDAPVPGGSITPSPSPSPSPAATPTPDPPLTLTQTLIRCPVRSTRAGRRPAWWCLGRGRAAEDGRAGLETVEALLVSRVVLPILK